MSILLVVRERRARLLSWIRGLQTMLGWWVLKELEVATLAVVDSLKLSTGGDVIMM